MGSCKVRKVLLRILMPFGVHPAEWLVIGALALRMWAAVR
jgi:hypothetical protein